ncbi:hypothetical protein CDD83_1482 [Cordyceps sp. RAO-2017]|nr:hypothetical protein CDD83_1482 [Cordyceps sp. RAO-2017]
MSSRVEKSRSRKTSERLALASSIEEFGFDVMPCSSCRSRGSACKMMDGVSRCKECVRRGRSCDASGVPLDALSRITAEHRRLKSKEKEAEQELLEAHRRASEAIARLARLRSQREMLASKGAKMVNLGLQTLDELEAEELRESENLASTMRSVEAMSAIDWSSLGLPEDFVFDPPVAGGTVATANHNGSGG